MQNRPNGRRPICASTRRSRKTAARNQPKSILFERRSRRFAEIRQEYFARKYEDMDEDRADVIRADSGNIPAQNLPARIPFPSHLRALAPSRLCVEFRSPELNAKARGCKDAKVRGQGFGNQDDKKTGIPAPRREDARWMKTISSRSKIRLVADYFSFSANLAGSASKGGLQLGQQK